MNKIILATGSDYKYLDKIQRYLNSISENSNFDRNILVYLGDKNEINREYKNVEISILDKNKLQALNTNNCVQHGEFILSDLFDEVNESDVIVFTDGDVYLQRPLFDDEYSFMKNIKDNDVWVGYNAGPNDTLQDEFSRLQPTGYVFPYNFNNIKCYNTGILCMNKKTWKRLSDSYVSLVGEVDKMFKHYAKQQWLISFILKDFKVYEMNYDIHNHNIYGAKYGMNVKGSDVYYFDKKSLFRHKWF
jgi:hypothetical protein